MKKERILYLDILKFLAMVLVCSYHFSWCTNISYTSDMHFSTVVNRFIFSFNSICIPLFLMVNGALLLNKDLNLKKHSLLMLKLLIQYYIWRLITIIVIAGAKNINLLELGKIKLFETWLLLTNIKGIDLAAFWFIPAFLCIQLIFPFIKLGFDYLTKKENTLFLRIIIIIILILVCILPNDLNILRHLFPNINIEFSGIANFNPFQGLIGPMLIYFVLGGYIHKIKDEKSINGSVLILGLFAGLFLLTFEWYTNSEFLGKNYDNIFGGYSLFSTLMIACSCFLLFSKITNSKMEKHKYISCICKTVGDNTLVVYYCHWIFGYTLLKYFYPTYFITNFTNFSIIFNFIKACIMVITISIFGCVMKKIPIINKLFC